MAFLLSLGFNAKAQDSSDPVKITMTSPSYENPVENLTMVWVLFNCEVNIPSNSSFNVENTANETIIAKAVKYDYTTYYLEFYRNEEKITITEPGDYTIVFPVGSIPTYADESVKNTTEHRITYTISERIDPFELIRVYPENNSAVDALTEVWVQFAGEVNISSRFNVENTVGETIKVKATRSGSYTTYYFTFYRVTLDENGLEVETKITAENPLKPGNYTIVIPEGSIHTYADESVKNPTEYRFTYTINAPAEPEPTPIYNVTPAENTAETAIEVPLQRIEFALVDKNTMLDPSFADGAVANIYKDDDFNTVYATGSLNSHESAYAMVVIKCELNEAGKYTVVIPAGAFTFNGEENTEIRLTYYVKEAEVLAYYSVSPAENTAETPIKDALVTSANHIKINLVKPQTGSFDPIIPDGTTVNVYKDDNFSQAYTQFNVTTDDNDWAMLNLRKQGSGRDCSESGKYIIVIPADTYTFDGLANEEIRLTYYIAPKVTPAENTPETPISEGGILTNGITINLISATEGSRLQIDPIPGDDRTVNIYKDDNFSEVYTVAKIADYHPSDYGAVYIQQSEGGKDCSENGKYTVVIPAGAYTFQDVANEEIRLTYYVGEAPELVFNMTFTPDPSQPVEYLYDNIYVEFPDYPGQNIEVDGSKQGAVYDASQNEVTIVVANAGNPAQLMVIQKINLPGEYTLSIPEGMLKVNNQAVPAFEVTYTIEGEEHFKIIETTPATEEQVEVLEYVEVTFESDQYYSNSGYRKGAAIIYDESSNQVATADMAHDSNDYRKVRFTLSEPIAISGNYTFKLQQGVLYYMGDMSIKNPEIKLNFTVDNPVDGYIYVNDQMGKGKLTLTADGLTFQEEELGSWAQEDLMTRSGVTYNKRFAYSIIGEKQASYDITYTWEDETSKQTTFEMAEEPTDGYVSFEGDIITGIDGIDAENAPVEYFNMQGIRVENPESGLYIRRQGNKTEKVVIKK